MQHFLGAMREFRDAATQCRRGLFLAERFDAEAIFGEIVQRQIDTVEIAIIQAAILKVIVDLQRGAYCV